MRFLKAQRQSLLLFCLPLSGLSCNRFRPLSESSFHPETGKQELIGVLSHPPYGLLRWCSWERTASKPNRGVTLLDHEVLVRDSAEIVGCPEP